MSFLRDGCIRLFLIATIFVSFNQQIKAQTTLVTGDIAFTGYISNDVVPDQFSFTILVPVTANTVIKFTDYGWRTDVGGGTFTNRNGNLESELIFTAGSAFPAGTEILINSHNDIYPSPATATVVGGGSAGTVVTSAGASFLNTANFSLSSSGDQIFIYQGTFASPTFITGIHMNVYSEANGDPVVPASGNTSAANWDGVITTPASFESANSSGKPAALTTGTNALWIGTAGNIPSEEDNARFNCASAPITTGAQVRAACNNQANWTTNDLNPSGLSLPTGCNFIGYLSSPPSFTTHPASVTICEGANTSFTIVATGAASYQWQVDNGGGFANITNNATYSGATATTLNVTAVTNAMNGYLYRCVATNGSGSTNSNNATLTVTALPVNPTLLAKTPNTGSVADGTPVSATFNAGSGGSGGCVDDFRYTTNGGVSYLPYTPGSNISTTGIAAGTGFVFIEGRRAGCASCSNSYVVLASWVVTPLPAAATTLNAGDIAFTAYTSTTAADDFSFVLLKNIGPGTVINFTDNGWNSTTSSLQATEQTVTWTSNAAYSAGIEIKISGLTATLVGGGSAGTVTGTAISLSTVGDQVLAYRGTAASPTFISGIHMNVYSTTNGDAVSTTAAAWDGAGTANTTSNCALPPGLTTGVNCIWIGTQDVPASEFDNSHYGNCAGPGTLGPIVTLRATLNNQANWISDNSTPPAFLVPTGCPYLGIGAPPPTINTNPTNQTVCESASASFSITATGALTYQWQEDQGGGFNNLSNGGAYSGVTTATLTINPVALSMNNYAYRCIASNGAGSTTSASATLTVNALPVSPTLLLKTPNAPSVADGTPVSATFNAGSGGTGCADDFRYTTDGGTTYLPYTPGSNISTTGIAAGSGFVFIEGRRANCSAGCQGAYSVLAAWRVTPLPAAATTLNAGDIAFSAYTSTSANDDFSFVLLKHVGPGTTINFTDNGWLSTNVFASGEQTVTWTAPAGGLPGGTEIKISGLTATRSGGGAAGTVTGTGLSLSVSGDQILAYRGTVASPTFISAIHMNVYNVANGDPVTTTAAAWDGTATGFNASALPTGLTTGVNCIWIGTQGDNASEHDNAKYGNCSAPVVLGSVVALRAALNNQAFWIVDDNTPPLFTQPTGCNYLNALAPIITVTGTPLSPFTACAGTPSAEQILTVSGNNLTGNITISAPANFEVSLISGSGFSSSVSLTPASGTVAPTSVFVRTTAGASGNPSGNITAASAGAATVTVAVSATINPLNTITLTSAPATINQTVPVSTPIGNITYATTGATGATFSGLPTGVNGVWAANVVTISGTPTVSGTFNYTVTLTGGCGTVTANGTINVVACGGSAVVQIGTAASGTFGNNTISNFTVPAGTNRLLVVTASDANGITSITSVTFGGTPMIKQKEQNDGTAVDAIFTLALGTSASPITGNIVMTSPSAEKFITATAYQNADQATPVSASNSTFNSTIPSASTLSAASAANDLGFDIFDYFRTTTAANSATFGGGQTSIISQGPFAVTGGFGYYSTSQKPGGAPNVTMSRTTTDGTALIHVVANIKAAPGSANTIALSSAAGTNNQTVCINTPITNITYATTGATGATFSGLPAGVTGVWAANVATISGTPTVSGTFNYAVSLTGGCGGGIATGTITVNANNTITLTSAAGTNAQTVCISTPITNITYATTGATGATFSGLPTGVTGNWAANVVTISGTPTASGTFNYTVTMTGGCGGGTATGSITVNPNNTITLSSAAGTNAQTVCINTPITNITYNTTGATGATFSGLPAGVNGNWAANVVTISGTPTAPGTFNYTVTLTGGCGAVTANGSVTVNPNNTINRTSAAGTDAQTVCINTPITNITYATTGATGATFSGLPAGVNGNWAANVVTISGTPTASGTFNYTVTLTGGCGGGTATGSITVNPNNTITLTSAPGTNNQTVLINTPITNITYSTTGATGATFSGLPTGVTGNWAANVVTISGTPTVQGLFNYTVTLTGGCGTIQATGSINVIVCSISLTSAAGTNAQTVCQNTPVTNITYATTGATGATFSGLPAGVTGNWAANVVTISGSPTVSGTFNYTVTPTGGGCSGAITATGTITVIATPAISCPANTTVAACQTQAAVNAQFAAWLLTASGSGGVGGVLTNNNTGAPSACGGSTTVTFTYTNTFCAPLTITCQATFTVTAPPPVVLICPANITVVACQTQASINAQFTTWLNTVSANGGCNGVLTNNNTGAPSACGGSTTVTFTYTSSCAPLITTCQATFTVVAPAPVVLTCPVNTTVASCQTQAAVNAQFAAWLLTASASGGCNGVFTNNNTGAPSACGGSTTVTFTYTSSCAPLTTTCQATFTVAAPPPVSITCPAPVTVSCASAVPPPLTISVLINSGCGVIVTWQGDVISNQTCPNRYTITRTYRGTDQCGNFSECTQIITVNDQTPPLMTCPASTTVSCASAVPAPNPASVTNVSDNCGGAVTVTFISDVISNQTCANRYTITRTYRATDACGNFTDCIQIITVNDQTPPVLTCPGPVTVSCASAVPAPNINAVTGVSDNCAGAVTVTFISDVINNQTCANRYTIIRTYRATDVCGNFAECQQIITVNDQTPPAMTCPAPVTVSCASAVPAPNPASVTNVSDNCGGAVTVTFISDVISNQTCANRYTITRTYRATDACGNFSECTQIITVNDQTPPVLTCPAPVTVSCASAVPAPDISLVTGVSDNCGGTVTVTFISDVISNQTCANRYTITRTYRATDVCGNFAQCTQIITVNDQTPPVLTCPQPLTVSCVSEVPAPNPGIVTGVSDNCGGPLSVTFVSDVISNQTCANRYTITRTYRATDVCGNFAQCTQIITVNDQTGPIISCPSNITVNSPAGSCTAVVNFTVTAADNCGGAVTIVSVPASGSVFQLGNTVVTSTATDVCGNVSTCTFLVTVRDGQLPVITQQPVNRRVCVGQNATFSVTAITSPNAGGPLNYQWQVSTNGASSFSNIPGATSSTLTLNNVTFSMNANFYRVVITGLCTTVISDHAVLIVHPLPTITLNALPFASILPPQSTSILAQVNPQGGTFVWSYNGSPLPSITDNIVPNINIDKIGAYQLVYTDQNGCTSTSAVLNITATPSYKLWVYPNPSTGRFTIRYYNPTGEQVTVKVYGPLGQQLYEKKLTLGVAYSNIAVDLGRPSPGVYTVRVFGASNVFITDKKVVVFLE